MKKYLIKFLYNFLAFWAKLYLKRTKPFIVGITGSVGKTSSRMIIFQVLKKYLKDVEIYSSPKNFNSEIGLILSIFKIEKYSSSIKNIIKLCFLVAYKSLFNSKKYDILLLEYGVDHPGDMDFLLKVAKPNIGIFTKLDNVHVEYFENKEAIGKEKFKLIKSSTNKVYLNYKDSFCKKNFLNLNIEKIFYFGGDIKIKNYNLVLKQDNITTNFRLGEKSIQTNILGEENAEYIGLAISILKDIDKNIYNNLGENLFIDIKNQAGRFGIFKGLNNSILIDSTYNASLESMKMMIENTYLLRKKLFPKYKVGFVLGDLRELGKQTKKSHKKLKKILQKDDYIITIGPETYKYLSSNLYSVKSFISSKKAGEQLKKFLVKSKDKYIILFKGSQNTIFTEEALKQVLKNKQDEKKLARQDKDWVKIKNTFFKTIK